MAHLYVIKTVDIISDATEIIKYWQQGRSFAQRRNLMLRIEK